MERARDLFEQALEKAPPKEAKTLFLLYARLEEEHGLARRAMDIYARAVKTVEADDRPELFAIYLARSAEFFGAAATRPIHEQAIHSLADKYASVFVCGLRTHVFGVGTFRKRVCAMLRSNASWVRLIAPASSTHTVRRWLIRAHVRTTGTPGRSSRYARSR